MKQFIITEQEKYNILKQYGLFEQSSRTIPTWSYSETKLPTSKIVEINFPFNQTKEVIINNKYNLGIKFFRNLNNKVGINVPDKIEINSIKLIDNSNKSYYRLRSYGNNNDTCSSLDYSINFWPRQFFQYEHRFSQHFE